MFLCLKNQDRKTGIIQPQKQTTQPAPCKSLAKWFIPFVLIILYYMVQTINDEYSEDLFSSEKISLQVYF